MKDSAIEIALQVTRVLDGLGVLHTIGGSIASSIAGEPCSTIDVDIVAAVRAEHVDALTRQLGQDFYVDETAVRRAVETASAVNLIHHETSVKIDLFVAGGTPLDAQQLSRRLRHGSGRKDPLICSVPLWALMNSTCAFCGPGVLICALCGL